MVSDMIDIHQHCHRPAHDNGGAPEVEPGPIAIRARLIVAIAEAAGAPASAGVSVREANGKGSNRQFRDDKEAILEICLEY
jgi:hypothetical protein